MAADKKNTTWGTVFIDANRESTVGKLDAMQAAVRQEQWNQRTQKDYLEKVRAKATERARTILGEAYTERQKILKEAEEDAERIRDEAKAVHAAAEQVYNQNVELRHATQTELDHVNHLRGTAHEEGFQQGLEAAQEEIENFRRGMGTSMGAVLRAIEDQCLNIFANWRLDLISLLKICVEKGTGLALDERHTKILEQLLINAVRHLDSRKHIVIRVNPDDEAVLMDLFDAAKERVPDLGHWIVNPDPAIEPGGLIAESTSGTVDSRLELFQEMVKNILDHLVLPEGTQETESVAFINRIVDIQAATVAALTPAPSEASPDTMQNAPAHAHAHSHSHDEEIAHAPPTVELTDDMDADDLINMSAIATGHEADIAGGAEDGASIPHTAAMAYGMGPQPDVHLPPDAPQELIDQLQPSSPSELARQQLEEELLPVPTEHDEILAAGGFLEPEDMSNQSTDGKE